jgi:translocation and assembly module TamB
MKISVNIEKQAHLHYQDLDANLGGRLIISAGPTRVPTATGELFALSGSYKAYGKTLTIQQGKLIFTGGVISNPGIDIKAARQVTQINTMVPNNLANTNTQQTYTGAETITVGVHMLGTITNPTVTLFSTPVNLTQDNILSYMMLGVPRSQANYKDSLAILNATSALNFGGPASHFSAVTKKLQDGLGLSELGVASVETFDPTANKNLGGVVGNTSLVVGKKIADKLYLHYSVSLFSTTPVSVLNLRYLLSKHWSIQSETSALDNGADILYSIERN